MNRSALVIKMLHILYGRKGIVSKQELAEKLETNPRNISEFKKELETAGYSIESVRGKYGGYILKEESVFPSLTFNESEKASINEALTYLAKQPNFIYYTQFESAMDKVKSKVKNRGVSSETIYMNDSLQTLNHEEYEMFLKLTLAKDQRKEVEFSYLSNRSDEFESRRVRPYEVIVNNDGCYVLVDDITPNKIKTFKFFKIITKRMHSLHVCEKEFLRDSMFKVSEHTGKHALMKEMYEVELKIKGLQARLINEREIENTLDKTWIEDTLYIHFMMEGNLRVKQFILSLGSNCEVIRPKQLKEEIRTEYIKSLQTYEK